MSVPKLRFKDDEGRDFPNWKTERIGNLFDVKAGGDISSNEVSSVRSETFKYPIYSNSDKNLGLFGFTDKFRIGVESITVTGRGALGIAVPRYEPYYPIVRLLCLLPKLPHNVYFCAQAINQLNIFVESTGVPQLTAPQISGYDLSMACKDEQAKIANFLIAVDEKISQLIQTRNLLTQYKKGVMQKIFNQELRFKDDDGRDFSKWEEKKLSDLLYETKARNRDLRYSREEVLSVSGEYGIVNQIELKGRSFAGESIANYHIVRAGDVVYTKSPLKNNPFGIIRVNKGKAGVVSTLYAVYGCKNGVSGEYLDYFFQLDANVNNYLRVLVNKGAKNDMKIKNSDVLANNITLPAEHSEQLKIVRFLTAIDDKITNAQSQLAAMKQYKQGLLQQMFV